ncbi:endoglucanase [Mesorhizobium australicum]|uniref:cellulase n=2 Tax=Mesorhizobium australicum TaxID=536018 RepID=A0A1X7PLA2_9HYPH|nr:glycosyl hydrolase family 8 [Mesorhizobium australicum]SMH52555.1 endoglucanase [Mesorhizobium australicum]
MRRLLWAAAIAMCTTSLAAALESTVRPDEWESYRARFVMPDGRVVDDGNGGISHSEGQGYGLILAYLAGNMADFDQVWTFTRTELLLRDDGLAAWRWEENANPHVTDPNNASDGDILIAYALALAGEAWQRPDLTAAARQLAEAIGRSVVYEYGGVMLLRPGVAGFDADGRKDGPVVNLSYWVFEAFPVLASLAPAYDWQRLRNDGVRLVRAARLGPRQLPPDWLALGDELKSAEGFPAEFGYNALRIPLYLIRDGTDQVEVLRRLREGMAGTDTTPTTVNLSSGGVRDRLDDPGYRILPALIDCVVEGTPIPEELRRFSPTLYYPSTLHLLALSHLRSGGGRCLP